MFFLNFLLSRSLSESTFHRCPGRGRRRWRIACGCLAVWLWRLPDVAAAVVINEIHYAPDVKTETVEFVELHNPGTESVSLAGWTLSGGIQYAFGANTQIGPGGYTVVAQNPEAIRQKFGVTDALGPWTGRLSNQADSLQLRNGSGESIDTVDYQLGFPWPTVGDSPGYSIELIHPNLDNSLGGSWRPSVHGNAATQSRSLLPAGSQWRFFKGIAEPSSPVTAWRTPNFDDSSWTQATTPIGYGENFVTTVLNDMRNGYASVFLRKDFVIEDPTQISTLLLEAQYDDGIKIWINGVHLVNANIASEEVPFDGTASSAIENAEFVPFPVTGASAFLRQGRNVIAVQAHNSSLGSSSDFFFDLRVSVETGSASRGPTPGRRNSVYAEDAPPQIRQCAAEPEQPATHQPVKVSAKVTDPDGVKRVQLEYQIVEPGTYVELSDAAYQTNWIALPMQDLGIKPDNIPGDATYSVEIPGTVQENRRLIRYRITAEDRKGQQITVPFADDPSPNFAYFVYDGVPAWRGAIQPNSADAQRRSPQLFETNVMRRLPVYHLISKQSSVEHSTWLDRYGGDLYKWKGTLVYDGRVYDHIGFRARGGVWRYAMGKNMWKFDFNRGHDFEPRDNYGRKYPVPWTKLNLGACIQQGDFQHRGEQGMFESVGLRLFALAGIEAPETHFVQFRVVDAVTESDPNNQYEGDFWGLYLAIEQEDGRFLDTHQLPDGNFYKMESGTGELNNLGAAGPRDKSDLNNFLSGYRQGDATDVWWRTHFDLGRYYSYQAIVQGIHHYDICYGKNYFYFLNPETGLWSVHPWDLDLTWADNMFDAGCGGTDEFKDRVLTRPAFTIEFQNRVREIRDLLFNTDQAGQLIDEYAAMIDDPHGGPSMVDADRAQWDYNPVMANSAIVNSSKAGQGRFYQVVPSKDFPGMVAKMKSYVVTRGTFLDNLANDPAIPQQPSLTSASPASFPANRLLFRVSAYAGAASFAAMEWRLGEVTPANAPALDPNQPRHYEIETVWQSAPTATALRELAVPAGVAKVGHTYRARARMQDSAGRWSHWSAPLEFVAGAPENAAALVANLQITEVMFDPVGGNDAEFIEVFNASPEVTLDLAGAKFTQGIDYTFPAGTTLPPGEFLLVVRSSSANDFASFRTRYGLNSTVRVVGPYTGALNNEGEQIILKTAGGGSTILELTVGHGTGWPLAAEGAGHSLVPVEGAASHPNDGSLNYPGNWRASALINGSPGRPDPVLPAGIVLNEIVAHTDFTGEFDSNDWIELYNPASTSFDFGAGWFLSDDPLNLRKWPIPSQTTVTGHGWIVFDEVNGFHTTPAGFGLSKDGEQVLLSHLPGSSADRVVDAIRFKAQENDWSLGRFPDGVGYWAALTPRTPLKANAPPQGHVVIDEVMFHPKDIGTNAVDNTQDEFIELWNATAVPVNLFNTNGTWRLNGGVSFLIPGGTVLPPGEALLVVNFSPTNTAAAAAFRTVYSVSPSVLLFGPYQGKLNNSSDYIALEKPQATDATNSGPAWVVVDDVLYSDRSPWPATTDGTGMAMQRLGLSASGNDPANWGAAPPSPGQAPIVAGDSDHDGLPDDWERTYNLNPNSAADAELDADSDGLSNLQEYRAGTNPRDASSTLSLNASLSGGTAVIRFIAMPGRSYGVYYRDALTQGSWQLLKDVTATGGSDYREAIDTISPTIGQRYYRVQLRE